MGPIRERDPPRMEKFLEAIHPITAGFLSRRNHSNFLPQENRFSLHTAFPRVSRADASQTTLPGQAVHVLMAS